MTVEEMLPSFATRAAIRADWEIILPARAIRCSGDT
jgi:hypothetical protein